MKMNLNSAGNAGGISYTRVFFGEVYAFHTFFTDEIIFLTAATCGYQLVSMEVETCEGNHAYEVF
jgi:hypothetical protein